MYNANAHNIYFFNGIFFLNFYTYDENEFSSVKVAAVLLGIFMDGYHFW